MTDVVNGVYLRPEAHHRVQDWRTVSTDSAGTGGLETSAFASPRGGGIAGIDVHRVMRRTDLIGDQQEAAMKEVESATFEFDDLIEVVTSSLVPQTMTEPEE